MMLPGGGDERDGAQLYVNTGTGYWLLPFRLGVTLNPLRPRNNPRSYALRDVMSERSAPPRGGPTTEHWYTNR